jgi:hypothetical protein
MIDAIIYLWELPSVIMVSSWCYPGTTLVYPIAHHAAADVMMMTVTDCGRIHSCAVLMF